jgi:hypothetical protein
LADLSGLQIDVETQLFGPEWFKKIADGRFASRVTGIGFNGDEINDDHIARARSFSKLFDLLIHDCPNVDGTGLRKLSSLTRLENVLLRNTNIGRAGLKNLRVVPALDMVVINDSDITDADLASLAGLKNLKTLDLESPTLTGSGLRHLKPLDHLESLAITSPRFDDSGLSFVKELPQLKRLYLRCPVTDHGIAQLNAMKNLKHLYCRNDATRSKVAEKLKADSAVDLWGQPLSEALDFIAQRSAVLIRIDESAIESDEMNVQNIASPNEQMTKYGAMSELLDLLLTPHGLVAVIDEDGLVVTTVDGARRRRPGITSLADSLPGLDADISW